MTSIKNNILTKKISKKLTKFITDIKDVYIYLKIVNNVCTYRILKYYLPNVQYETNINITVDNRRLHIYKCAELPFITNQKLITNFPANIPDDEVDDTLADMFKNIKI